MKVKLIRNYVKVTKVKLLFSKNGKGKKITEDLDIAIAPDPSLSSHALSRALNRASNHGIDSILYWYHPIPYLAIPIWQ